ncbi:MAG: hypothetical protein P4L56_03110 [Candidatus Sulfopaludibacter sp.]|nr:hypothetical protein [Candidatus Sulfopaludibacter sp.]
MADVLRENRRRDLRVFVIWEPVLETDWGTPSPALTGDVADPRVMHFWDRDRRLSAWFGGARKLPALAAVEKVGFRMTDVIWDTALLYPPAARWGDAATVLLAPVVKYRADLALALR